nr:unnamed protein product [Digitaria exilis]
MEYKYTKLAPDRKMAASKASTAALAEGKVQSQIRTPQRLDGRGAQCGGGVASCRARGASAAAGATGRRSMGARRQYQYRIWRRRGECGDGLMRRWRRSWNGGCRRHRTHLASAHREFSHGASGATTASIEEGQQGVAAVAPGRGNRERERTGVESDKPKWMERRKQLGAGTNVSNKKQKTKANSSPSSAALVPSPGTGGDDAAAAEDPSKRPDGKKAEKKKLRQRSTIEALDYLVAKMKQTDDVKEIKKEQRCNRLIDLQEEKIELEREKFEFQRDMEDERILSLDLSNMTYRLQQYY